MFQKIISHVDYENTCISQILAKKLPKLIGQCPLKVTKIILKMYWYIELQIFVFIHVFPKIERRMNLANFQPFNSNNNFKAPLRIPIFFLNQPTIEFMLNCKLTKILTFKQKLFLSLIFRQRRLRSYFWTRWTRFCPAGLIRNTSPVERLRRSSWSNWTEFLLVTREFCSLVPPTGHRYNCEAFYKHMFLICSLSVNTCRCYLLGAVVQWLVSLPLDSPVPGSNFGLGPHHRVV